MSTGSHVIHTIYAQASPGSLEDGSRAGTIVVTAGCYLLALVALGVAISHARGGRYLGLGCLLQQAVRGVIQIKCEFVHGNHPALDCQGSPHKPPHTA